MANREIERYVTNAYTTYEGVSVKEEHFWIPLRSAREGEMLKAVDLCELDLVTFERPKCQPVYWVRESRGNESSDKDLQSYVFLIAGGEMRSHQQYAEQITLFLERNDGKVGQIPYYTPPMGEGSLRNRAERESSLKEVDRAIKENLSCKEDLASKYLEHKHLPQADLFEKTETKQEKELPHTQLWRKVRSLNDENAPETKGTQSQEAVQKRKG